MRFNFYTHVSFAALLATDFLFETADAKIDDTHGGAFDLYNDDYEFAQVDADAQDDLSEPELAQIDAEFTNAVDDPEIAMINAQIARELDD